MIMKKKETRGGPGRGQGLKKGTEHKNALKKSEERRSIRKMVTYTDGESVRVSEALVQREYKDFNAFAREATLKLTEDILTGNDE